MLGDYSEFEIVCNVLECNELVKYLFGICLMMFQLVSHSSCARHLKNHSQIVVEQRFGFFLFLLDTILTTIVQHFDC